jgi:hypothetical protein
MSPAPELNRLERLAEALRPVTAEEAARVAAVPDLALDMALRQARLTRADLTGRWTAIEASPVVMRHLLRLVQRQGERLSPGPPKP